MAFELFPVVQWFDNSGLPLSGGLISTFVAGSTTPQATYTDSTGGTPQANPVVLDAAGRAQIWFAAASYKLVLKTAAGVTLMTIDNVTLDNLAATISTLTMTGALTMQQSTAATNVANQSSNVYSLQGTYWNGSASAADIWQLQDVLGAGTNPTSSLTITHSGSTGTATINIPSVALTLGMALTASAKLLNAIRFADQFTGASVTAQINAAENDLSTNPGLVIVPSTMGSGAGQSLLTKDNIFVIDLRSPASSAQQQGTHLLLNVKDTGNGNVRSKMMLVDPVQPSSSMQAGSSSASSYVHTFAEGNLSGFATLEAINGTITVDAGATNSPTTVVGIEGEASVSGTAANTITDLRGGTFNVGLTGAGLVTNATAIQAQAATQTGAGTATNAYGLVCEDQTIGTSNNLGILNKGKAAFSRTVSFGNFNNGSGSVPQAAIMLFVRPVAGDIAGGTQIGIQSAPVTSSGATATGIGIITRADTDAAAFTQTLNVGLQVSTPTVGAGSAITEWNGVLISAGPTAGTKWAIKAAGTENYSLGGKVGVYNALTTAGNGVAAIYGSTSQKAETAADTNVLTFTPPAAVGSYRVRFTMAVSAQNTATLGWTATWKDANGSAQAPTNLALFTSGTAAPALTVTAATNGNYYGSIDIDTDNSATAIVVKLTFAGTSFAAKVSATVERIA